MKTIAFKQAIIVLITIGLSSISNAHGTTNDPDIASITAFELRNDAHADAFAKFAFDNTSVQNLYIGNDDIDKVWPIWRSLFLPTYTNFIAEKDDNLYLLTYNPLAEVGTISKWKRVNNGLKYQDFFVVTAEYLRGKKIIGEPPLESWLDKLQREGKSDLLSSFTQTATEAYGRWFNKAEVIEAALKDLSHPEEIPRSAGKPKMTDRDVALLRVADMAGRLAKGLSDPESKTQIDETVECLDGRHNELCPSAVQTEGGKKGENSISPLGQTCTTDLANTYGPWIPEDFLQTEDTKIIFSGSIKYPSLINIAVVSNQQFTCVTRIDLAEKLNEFVSKNMIGKF